MSKYFVYIMSNSARTLYVGVTGDLDRRVLEHKQKLVPDFTSRYNITELVRFQDFDDPSQAIEAEKRIKAWRRSEEDCPDRGNERGVARFERASG